jgi:hypothetical protein
MKTLDLCGLGDGGTCCVVTFLGVLSWSLGLRSLIASSVKLDTFYFLLFIFDLLVRGFLITMYQFGHLTLFIKQSESLFRETDIAKQAPIYQGTHLPVDNLIF